MMCFFSGIVIWMIIQWKHETQYCESGILTKEHLIKLKEICKEAVQHWFLIHFLVPCQHAAQNEAFICHEAPCNMTGFIHYQKQPLQTVLLSVSSITDTLLKAVNSFHAHSAARPMWGNFVVLTMRVHCVPLQLTSCIPNVCDGID